MLVHICCSVDSHYFLQKLQVQYPEEKLTGFFYDPNIHPYSEYYLRLLDVRRSCKMLGIDLIEGDYDVENWLEAVRGLEHEPEKGSRCSVCFDRRFEVTAQQASQMGESTFTSTLLTSPKKSLKQLQIAGDALAEREGIAFVAPDFRKASGTQEQNILAKEDALYRQDYCGCMFGLNIQRDQQNKLADELFVPLSKQIQPESIEDRIQMYEKRWEMEEANIPHKIIKQRFLNWRLMMGLLRVRKEVVPAHFLPYSTLKGEYTRGKIEYNIDEVHHMNRDEVRFITLKHYNELANSDYATVTDLIYSPPSFDEELAIRAKLGVIPYDLSIILVVEEIPTNKIEILCHSKVYSDVKEVLIRT
ncbi:MAG: epoxyqueuosine reductase QueH [Epsilonproteobacteria bacterium]|nr:MAG: epoxyqueuosine reductase QueH [Campylobacterota bacterium]